MSNRVAKAVSFPPYNRALVQNLIPYARNARTHSDEQIAQIAASIREFGFTNPVLVDGDHGIIAGHGRVLAARKLGMTEVPTLELAHLSETQRRAYVLVDNKLALNAGWDEDLLRLELGELKIEGFDLALTGFGLDELASLFAEPTGGLTDPDAVPDVPESPVARAGDLWLLGRHRLACGDATTVEAVDAALGGVKPHLMVTDPPYGVEYDPAWRNAALAGSKTARIGKVLNDDRADWSEAWALFPGDVAYVWHGALHSSTVAESLNAAGFEIRAQVIWAKDRLVMGRGHYHWQHEPCWYAVRGGATGHWSGDRKQTTLWSIPTTGQDAKTTHGTQKPVECMKRPIENNSSPGQAIYEPFSGSGTTIIAAEMTGRSCHAIELSPAYVDVAVLRWQAFTGQQAVLEAQGQSFEDIAVARAAEEVEPCKV
ncbi:site-specific DNA-methyltransferase [Falsiroseomonas sp. E2-1-a20]|uniref:site-specific DNA-methyltransferase n=1 Tax=Falsiroseomonas sp. E2-1-a20 TaxID=3239300 RepID=UPI003F372193